MNRYLVTFVVMPALLVLASSPAGAKTSAGVAGPGGTWGNAREAAAPMNQGGDAAINSVSCASAGNCSAGGYTSAQATCQAFVVSEVDGTWGTAKEVPGTAALNQGGDAGRLGVVRLGGQLQRRRVLHTTAPAASRRSWSARSNGIWGKADRGARHRGPEQGRSAESPRCRAPRRATAAPAGTTQTAPATTGVRGQRGERQLGHGRARCPAPRPSTRAATPRSTRCRAPRRATAAPAGPTPTAPATRRRSWSAR